MAVSISQITKDIKEIHKTLGERIVFYTDDAVKITRKVNEIVNLYRNSSLFILDNSRLSEIGMDRLSEVLKDAINLNVEYEKFLKMVGLARLG